FFSSRRRHTRWPRDWSSDVCSSDLILEVSDLSEMQVDAQIDESNIASVKSGQRAKVRISAYPDELFDGTVKLVGLDVIDPRMGRSEERRVGKECRWVWAACR